MSDLRPLVTSHSPSNTSSPVITHTFSTAARCWLSPRGDMTSLRQLWSRRKREKRRTVDALVMRETGGAVRAGPFAGLQYPVGQASGSSLSPKLLGCYELEIHDFIEEAIARRPERIVNVGAGEGYYAVGMALRAPNAEVFAFDIDEGARSLTKAMAELNGAGNRVHIYGECTPDALAELTRIPALVICDVEGAERELLEPESVPGLRHCEIIAELHRVDDDDLAGELRKRFELTHSSRLAHYHAGAGRAAFQPGHLSAGDSRIAIDERRRHGLDWIHLVPR